MASVVPLVWAKLAHHAGKALGPIAGAKGTTACGHANDVGLFGSVMNHRIEVLSWPERVAWVAVNSSLSYVL